MYLIWFPLKSVTWVIYNPALNLHFYFLLYSHSCYIYFYLQFTTVIYIGLFLFEDLDTSLIVVGLLGNAAYFALLQSFPYFILSSPSFIASVGMYWQLVIHKSHYIHVHVWLLKFVTLVEKEKTHTDTKLLKSEMFQALMKCLCVLFACSSSSVVSTSLCKVFYLCKFL